MKESFQYAFRGALSCVKTERNFRIHLAVTFYVLISSVITRLNEAEWAAVLICAGAVMGAELFNTAIEKLCDTLHPGRDRRIGHVKDIAAGAVLMFAVASAAVGGVIFFSSEKMTRMLTFIRERTAFFILIAATLPVAVFLVFRRYGNDHKNSHDNDSRTTERR